MLVGILYPFGKMQPCTVDRAVDSHSLTHILLQRCDPVPAAAAPGDENNYKKCIKKPCRAERAAVDTPSTHLRRGSPAGQ